MRFAAVLSCSLLAALGCRTSQGSSSATDSAHIGPIPGETTHGTSGGGAGSIGPVPGETTNPQHATAAPAAHSTGGTGASSGSGGHTTHPTASHGGGGGLIGPTVGGGSLGQPLDGCASSSGGQNLGSTLGCGGAAAQSTDNGTPAAASTGPGPFDYSVWGSWRPQDHWVPGWWWGGDWSTGWQPDHASLTFSLYCTANDDGSAKECSVSGTISSAVITSQYSTTECEVNQNWGVNQWGIWVLGGCQAQFQVYYQ